MKPQFVVVGQDEDGSVIAAYGPLAKTAADDLAQSKNDGDDDGTAYSVVELKKPDIEV